MGWQDRLATLALEVAGDCAHLVVRYALVLNACRAAGNRTGAVTSAGTRQDDGKVHTGWRNVIELSN